LHGFRVHLGVSGPGVWIRFSSTVIFVDCNVIHAIELVQEHAFNVGVCRSDVPLLRSASMRFFVSELAVITRSPDSYIHGMDLIRCYPIHDVPAPTEPLNPLKAVQIKVVREETE
jgi:hypothetical protein